MAQEAEGRWCYLSRLTKIPDQNLGQTTALAVSLSALLRRPSLLEGAFRGDTVSWIQLMLAIAILHGKLVWQAIEC